MPAYVALLRAVNVGGTGKLAMKDLAELCCAAGCTQVSTYIQSGNVVLVSRRGEKLLKGVLEKALAAKVGKPINVLVRTAGEMADIVRRNPFPEAAGNRVLALLLDAKPAAQMFADLPAPGGEQLACSGREVFVHYPNGQGRSKLKLPLADVGTMRNLNTLRKLAAMAAAVA